MKTTRRASEAPHAFRKQASFFEELGELNAEEQCIRYLEQVRWPDGLVCVRKGCSSRRITTFDIKGKTGKTRHMYECIDCHYQYSITTGTIFHNSHLPLSKWFFAIHLMCSTENGVSAKDLERRLKVNYRTALHMLQRLRRIIHCGTG